jgi:hypothetical protein
MNCIKEASGKEPMQDPDPFPYPLEPHARKHGPAGYTEYDSFRPWLRDEFSFRCVFCLSREQWGKMLGLWDIDHLIPQSRRPSLILSFDNLLYVCRSCNVLKSSSLLADPCGTALAKCMKVQSNGQIVALNDDGKLLIDTPSFE